jgi:hypothetical protein
MSMYRLTLVASDWRIPERTLRRWVHEGRLTARRKGRVLYVDTREAGQLVELQHAGGGRMDRMPAWPIDCPHSGGMSPSISPAISPDPMSGALS